MNNKLQEIKTILSGSIKGWNQEELTEKEFFNLVETEYDESWFQYLDNNVCLYRGEKNLNTDKIYIIDTEERTSHNTDNYYTILFSEILPSWKNWPKRNHCVVCTNDRDTATIYTNSDDNNIFHVFPINGTTIAKGLDSDIWSCFKKGLMTIHPQMKLLTYFNDFIKGLGEVLGINPNTKDGMISFIEKLQENIKSIEIINKMRKIGITELLLIEFKNFRKLVEENNGSVLNTLDKILDPSFNGNKLINPKILDDIESNECWFDAPSIFISEYKLKEITGNM